MAALRGCPQRLFQFRLAQRFGRIDVDEFIDEITPQQYRQWWAFAIAEGWGHEWEQTTELMAFINNAANRQVASMVGGADEMEWLTGREIWCRMTGQKYTKQKPSQMDPDQHRRMMEARFRRGK